MPFLPLPKAKAKLLRKLEQRKYRQEFKLYVIEGYRNIQQVFQSNPKSIQFILRSTSCKYDELSVETFELPDLEFAEFSSTEHSQGVLAVVRMPEAVGIDSILSKSKLLVALDAIQDPGNLGTIIRNSIWFGVDSLILGTGTVDAFNPKVVRSAMSNMHSLPLLSVDLVDLFDKAEQQGWQIFLLRLDSNAQQIHEINFPVKSILVIGNEGRGIHSDFVTSSRTSVYIPSYNSNDIESLNASIASALALQAYRLQNH